LFNCWNGTLDLTTGTLRHHNRGDMLTQICWLDYRSDAVCPLWDQTLEIFLPDKEIRDFFQRLCGYAMTGIVRDHILPVCYGTGSNGKSTILGALLEVFGPDYAMKAPPDLIMSKKYEAHPTERADLFRKRLVVAIETEEGRRLNETLVKEFTGGDRIRARRMHEDFWEFDPTHKIFLATNHKPVIRDTTDSTWRRIKEIPFTVKLADDKADKTVPERLRAEYPGILAWCVRGCLGWQRDGLLEPKSVTQATSNYRQSQDVFGAFLEEHVSPKQNSKVGVKELYELYKGWAEASNTYCFSGPVFRQSMQERGYVSKKSGHWSYLDIELCKPTAPGGTASPF
jgi:putative DNA primase/helicase